MSIADLGLKKTAFVLAGGGSFGAIQVGMMHSLTAHGIFPDMVVGSSVGAINGAYYAGDPSLKGVLQLETIWRGLKRQDVFPLTMRTLLSFLWRRDFLIPHDGIQKLIDDHIPYRNLEDARLPLHIVTTDILSGDSVVLSEGPLAQAVVASTAIPGAFAPIRYKDIYLADGAISSNTPIRVAVAKGATRLIIMPTGYACAPHEPPKGAVASALHADPADRPAAGRRMWKTSIPESNTTSCRRYARWSARPTTSRGPRIISPGQSRPPMPGWRKAGWSKTVFRESCARTAIDRSSLHCDKPRRGAVVVFRG